MASTKHIRDVRQTAIIYTVVVFIGEPKREVGGGCAGRETEMKGQAETERVLYM